MQTLLSSIEDYLELGKDERKMSTDTIKAHIKLICSSSKSSPMECGQTKTLTQYVKYPN